MTIDESSKPLQFQVEPTCKKEWSMMKVMKVMIMMKLLEIDNSKLLQFQVEPTCKEEGSMVGGGWSLYTKRSCQGGGEVKQRVVYICLGLHFCVFVCGSVCVFVDAGVVKGRGEVK